MSSDIDDEVNVITTLSYPRRRGRPKKTHPKNDSGTPELIMKRLMGETAEALDLCLERAIITPEQHWCGIHLRWLYTLRHGVPSVRAIDPTHLKGIEINEDDPTWRHAREQEYHEAVKRLSQNGLATMVFNLCIYNERPRFLSLHRPVTQKRYEETAELITGLREGLDILVEHWGRKNFGKKK